MIRLPQTLTKQPDLYNHRYARAHERKYPMVTFQATTEYLTALRARIAENKADPIEGYLLKIGYMNRGNK